MGRPLRRVPAVGNRAGAGRPDRHPPTRERPRTHRRSRRPTDHADHDTGRTPAHERGRRVRPRAGRRHRARRRHPAQRRAGRRQVHAAARGRRAGGTCRAAGAVRERRGVPRSGAAARRAHRRAARRAVPGERDRPRHDPRPHRRGAAAARDRRLRADGVVVTDRRRGRTAQPGARGRRDPHPRRQGAGPADHHRRSRHERRAGRRPPRAGAPGRRGVPLRGRPADVAALHPRAQETASGRPTRWGASR